MAQCVEPVINGSESASSKPTEIANKVAAKQEADVLLYNGIIARPYDQEFIELVRKQKAHANVILMLVTEGGDPDAAYRMARALQRDYEKFICYVSGYCKSAGTLLAIGADELIMCDHGELGPLDIQLSKKDELFGMESGAVAFTAIHRLYGHAFLAFEHFFLTTLRASGFTITTRTAANIATNLTTGLFGPVFQQIDPMHVGKAGREMSIANRYGSLLDQHSRNMQPGALDALVSGYPSQGFVIDREEALDLFRTVRCPDELERGLAYSLDELARRSISYRSDEPIMYFLSGREDESNPTREGESGSESNELEPTNAPVRGLA
ncbi:MAG: SppA protein [Chloroflexi bacterium]|nr:SppA protein [Chloroflexota bacterium]